MWLDIRGRELFVDKPDKGEAFQKDPTAYKTEVQLLNILLPLKSIKYSCWHKYQGHKAASAQLEGTLSLCFPTSPVVRAKRGIKKNFLLLDTTAYSSCIAN